MKKQKLNFEPLNDIGMTEDQIEEIVEIRKHSKAMLTDRVIRSIAKEFRKASSKGYSIDDCIEEWSCRSWRGFKAEWLQIKTGGSPEEAIKRLQEHRARTFDGQLE